MLKKIVKITLKIIEWLVFTVIVCVFFVSFSPLLPFKNMPKTYVVVTGSMIPTIMPGSISVVLPTKAEELQPGSIIAFKSPEDSKSTILHRINSIKSKDPLIFETKGDYNNAPDSWEVSSMDVIGRYLFSIPLFGYAAAFMKKPLGFTLMVGIPALIFIIFQIANIKKAIDEEVERRIKKEKEKSNKQKISKSVTQIIRSLVALISILSFASLVCTREILASFSDTIDVNNLAITIKDFVPPPVPTLSSPANNALLNTTGLVMRWNAVTDYEDMSGPVYYYYKSARNEGFSPVAYTSGKLTNPYIPAPGTSDGTYWWKVQACDAIDNCSDWSDTWKMVIDSTAPNVSFTNIVNNQAIRGNVEIKGSVIDAHPHHYWFVIQDSGGHTVAGPGTVNEDETITNKRLITWDTTTVADGKYTLKLEARDAANNKSGTTSVKWLTVWVENIVDVGVLTPVTDAVYSLGDTIHVSWNVSGYAAPGDLTSTVKVSTDGGANYNTEIASSLENDFDHDWVIPDNPLYKTKFMRIKVIVKDDFGNEFTAQSGIFDPVDEKEDEDKKESKENVEEKKEESTENTKSQKQEDETTLGVSNEKETGNGTTGVEE